MVAFSDDIDRLTGTFRADRRFCDSLFVSENAENFAEILVYYIWAHVFLPHFQKGILQFVPLHFQRDSHERARFWSYALSLGVMKDLRLIPYLLMRGLIAESGSVLRRSLEHVGVLTHIWSDPTKLRFLDEIDSKEYRDAFQSEKDKHVQSDLKARGVKKRFACLLSDGAASTLYEILSNWWVHGGSSAYLLHWESDPGQSSCWFLDRKTPAEARIDLLSQGVAILCMEIVNLYITHAQKYRTSCAETAAGIDSILRLFSLPPDPRTDEMKRQIAQILEGSRHQGDGTEAVVKGFDDWLLEKGITKDKVTHESMKQWFIDAGFEVTEDGIPLIPGMPGLAQACSRCGSWTECGTQGTKKGEPIVLCQECYLLMVRDTDLFHNEGWDEPISENGVGG